jgi:hypothetical protein
VISRQRHQFERIANPNMSLNKPRCLTHVCCHLTQKVIQILYIRNCIVERTKMYILYLSFTPVKACDIIIALVSLMAKNEITIRKLFCCTTLFLSSKCSYSGNGHTFIIIVLNKTRDWFVETRTSIVIQQIRIKSSRS